MAACVQGKISPYIYLKYLSAKYILVDKNYRYLRKSDQRNRKYKDLQFSCLANSEIMHSHVHQNLLDRGTQKRRIFKAEYLENRSIDLCFFIYFMKEKPF